MLIYFNGDSNTIGAELPQGQGFADIIAAHYNASKINHGLQGGSNDHIIRTTRDYLNDCKKTGVWPDLVVIGWTESFRTEWAHNGELKTVISIEAYNEMVDFERHEYVKTQMWHNRGWMKFSAMHWNESVYNLHCQLTYLKVPHLFFNAINSLNMQGKLPDYDVIRQYDFGKNFYCPYVQAMAMREWALDLDYSQITPGWFHFEHAAQQAWASILINHLEQNHIL